MTEAKAIGDTRIKPPRRTFGQAMEKVRRQARRFKLVFAIYSKTSRIASAATT